MGDAKRDANRIPTLLGVSNVDGVTPVTLYADPITHRLLVSTNGVDGSGTANELSYWVDANTLGSLAVATYPSLTELSYVKGVTSAIQTQFSGKLSLDQTTPQTIINGQPIQDTLTASQIVATDANKKLQTLAVATYPSLTEVSYLKGVTSAIQTQLNGKQASMGADDNYVTDAEKVKLGNLSNTNSGDNATNSQYSGLVTNATHTGDATGSTALTVVKINGTSLAGLATGILKNTTGTGVPSIAIASDFPTLNQNTSGTATNLSGTPTLPNGTLATTQSANDNSTKLATTAYVDSGSSTLTNKRVTARVFSTTTTATLTPDKASYDILTLTAQSGALTIANPTVTPNDGDQTRIRIYCPTTIGAITFGTNYVAKGGSALPTTTVLVKNMELGFEWNSSLGKYNLLALANEA